MDAKCCECVWGGAKFAFAAAIMQALAAERQTLMQNEMRQQLRFQVSYRSQSAAKPGPSCNGSGNPKAQRSFQWQQA